MAFRRLFNKEARSLFPLYAVFLAAVILLHFFILYKSSKWDNDAFVVLSIVFPGLFAAFIAAGAGYYQLQSEWKTNSIYLLMSLPVRGWRILLAKLAANMVLLIGTTVGMVASFVLILLRDKWTEWRAAGDIPPALPTLLNVIFQFFWMSALALFFILVLVQFAYLCGQLVSKLKWVVVVAAFLGVLWLALRISPLIAGLLQWMPDIYFGGEDGDVVYLHAGPFVALFLMGAGLAWLNGVLFEKVVEV
jgi:hypothetical protein